MEHQSLRGLNINRLNIRKYIEYTIHAYDVFILHISRIFLCRLFVLQKNFFDYSFWCKTPSLKKTDTHNNHFYTQLLKRSKSHHVPRIRRVRATVFDHQGTNYNRLSFRNSFSFSFARFYSLPSGAFAAAERIASRSENKRLIASLFSLYY